MNILKKTAYTLFLMIAVTLAIGPSQTFAATPAAATPAAATPAAATPAAPNGCSTLETYKYTDMCVLPPYRWGDEKLVNDTQGNFGFIKGVPAALGGVLFIVSGMIWQGLLWVIRFGLSTGTGMWSLLDAPIARVTSVFGGTLLPLSISLVLITMIMGAKKTFSKGNIFMNFIRQGSSWLLPFSLLFILVSSSTAATEKADLNKDYDVSSHVGTAAWAATTVDRMTNQVAAKFSGLNVDLVKSSTLAVNGPSCMEYINTIHAKYTAANDAKSAKPEAAAPAMVAVSNLWLNTHYANVIRGQFGTPSGDLDLPGLVGCHAYESWNNVSVAEQHSISNESNPDLKAVKNAGIFGPHLAIEKDGQFVKAMTVWAACLRDGNAWKPRDPYKFMGAKRIAIVCPEAFTTTETIPSGKRDHWNEFYIFGEKAYGRLRESDSFKSAVGDQREINEQIVRPAAEMAGAMGGLGTSRLLYGVMSIISAILSLVVIGPMAVGLLATVFMSIALVTVALPIALLLLAGGKANKAKPLFKAIASSLVAKAMFTIILTLIIAVIKLFNSIVLALEKSVPGGQLPSLIEAVLYGAAPLLAFFVVNKLLKMLVPNANLMNPVSTLSLAAQAAGVPISKQKLDKDGKPILGKDGKPKGTPWSKYRDKHPNSRLGKAKDALDRKHGQAGNIAPTWKNFKKFQPVKRFRSAAADKDYADSKNEAAADKAKRADAKGKKKAENAAARKEAADLRKNKGKRPDHEGLRRKRGEAFDPDAVAASKGITPPPVGESKNSADDNAKDNKDVDAAQKRAAKVDTGDPAADDVEAAKTVERGKQGRILSEVERDAIAMATLGTDNPKEAAHGSVTTTDGRTIDTRNPLDDKKALRGMTKPQLWESMRNPAIGLGAELEPKLLANGELETEAQTAARIQATMRSRGLTDNDGNEVHAMTHLGVNEAQLHDWVNEGSTGDKDLDIKLKAFEKGSSDAFGSRDHKAETQAIKIAHEVVEERIKLVEQLGLDGANSYLVDQKADIVAKGSDFLMGTEETVYAASVLAVEEPDPEKVIAHIKDMVEKQVAAVRTSTPMDDEVYERLVERAQKATVISVLKSVTVNVTAGKNPKMISALEEIVAQGAARSFAHTQPTAPTSRADIDTHLVTFTILANDSNHADAGYAAAVSPEDRQKSAKVVQIKDQELANITNTLRTVYETGMAQRNLEISDYSRSKGFSEEIIAAQQAGEAEHIADGKRAIEQEMTNIRKAVKDGDPSAQQKAHVRLAEILSESTDTTVPADAHRTEGTPTIIIGTQAAFAAAAKAFRTGGMT